MVITFSKLSKLYPPTISMFKTYYVCLRLFKLFSVNDKAKRKWDIFPDECCFWILLAESVYYAIKICLYHFLKVTRDLQLPGSVTSNYQAPWPPITRLNDFLILHAFWPLCSILPFFCQDVPLILVCCATHTIPVLLPPIWWHLGFPWDYLSLCPLSPGMQPLEKDF